VADCLVQANLRGLDSHGVARIPIYAKRLRLGLVNPRPTLALTRVAPSAAHLDGEDGMGMVAGTKAMEAAIALARDTGVGLVGVHRSTHYGMAAYYVLRAAAADSIGFAFTNSSAGMAPYGGTKPILGVNPLAVGVPAGRRPAIVLDMAMSVIARGKMRLAGMHGESIAEGLGVDAQGRPTTDGMAVFGGGAVHPFGGPKGSALAIWMEIMGGVLTGAAFAGDMKSLYEDFSGPQRIGHVFMAIRPDLFLSLPDFKARMDTMIERLKASEPAEGFDEVLMPGEPEVRREAERRRTGIPLTAEVLASLESESAETGIALPALSKVPIVGNP
jgi:LDH2 family malate/lactate/ureidoglycolate dehydrogenase